MEASNRGSFSTCHHQPESTQLQWPLHLPGLASRNYTHTRVHAHTHTAPGLQCQVTHLMLFPPPPWPHLRSPSSPHGSHHSPPPPPAVAVRSATTCLFVNCVSGCRGRVPSSCSFVRRGYTGPSFISLLSLSPGTPLLVFTHRILRRWASHYHVGLLLALQCGCIPQVKAQPQHPVSPDSPLLTASELSVTSMSP